MTPLATINRFFLPGLALLLLPFAEVAVAADWRAALKAEVERIDRRTPGTLGVYVERLDSGESFAYQADRPWYLASSAKLPIAIAVLQQAEGGELPLERRLRLAATDKVDGSGALVWQAAGSSYTVADLLRRMLMDSDNTAANMLVRAIGKPALAQRARAFLQPADGLQLTDFTQVRRDVNAEFDPAAGKLSNLDLVKLAAAPNGPRRVQALGRMLSVDPARFRVKTMDEAYARYYARGLNSVSLVAYGGMLEKLVRGELLSPASMKRLYRDLKIDSYDAYRLEKGLPRTVRFIHKTGTQFQRACHMGVIEPQDQGRHAIVVATCAEGLDEHRDAAPAFEALGRAITRTMAVGQAAKD